MYFKKAKLDEVYQSKNLYFWGLALFALHIINSFYWLDTLGSQTSQICWGSLPDCSQFLGLSLTHVLNKIYMGTAIAALIGFALKFRAKAFYIFLILNFLIKYLIYAAHFNLNSNTQVFLFFAEAALLFIPKKSYAIKYLFVSYLVSLGLLKLNPEWMSGFWLEQHITQMPLKGLEWVAAFSIFIELFASVGLLFKNSKVFFTSVLVLFTYATAQLIFLDVFSSLTLLLAIVFFVLNYYESIKLDRESIYKSYSEPEPSSAWSFTVPILYLAIQFFVIWGSADSALRNFPLSLRHFPTPLQCQQFTFVYTDQGMKEAPYRFIRSTSSDLDCNKDVAVNYAIQFCNSAGAKKVSSIFLTKHGRAQNFSTSFDNDDICTNKDN